MQTLIDLLFHLDDHLKELVAQYGFGTYAILFAIIFAETGLVIAPFLPGDSLLFAAGAIAATTVDGQPALNLPLLCGLLIVAAILGDTVNYHLGYFFGPRVFRNPKSFWLNAKHLERTQEFFDRHGAKTIILARFLPIVRTLAPFIAGVGKMNYVRFLTYNVIGGVVWVLTFLLLGYFFGSMPWVEKNFEIVIVAIIGISVLPALYEIVRHRYFAPKVAKPISDNADSP